MPAVKVTISISASEMLRFYEGTVDTVRAHTHDGRSVLFPINILRPYVTEDGVFGTFDVSFDHRGRFKNIRLVRTRTPGTGQP
jgi:hypothetical protein